MSWLPRPSEHLQVRLLLARWLSKRALVRTWSHAVIQLHLTAVLKCKRILTKLWMKAITCIVLCNVDILKFQTNLDSNEKNQLIDYEISASSFACIFVKLLLTFCEVRGVKSLKKTKMWTFYRHLMIWIAITRQELFQSWVFWSF